MTTVQIATVLGHHIFERQTKFTCDEAMAYGIRQNCVGGEMNLTVRTYEYGDGYQCDVAFDYEYKAVLKWNKMHYKKNGRIIAIIKRYLGL